MASELTKLSKLELLEKCKENGITKCSSKNKSQLIDLLCEKLEDVSLVLTGDSHHIENKIEHIQQFNVINDNSLKNVKLRKNCGLADIAPTVLNLIGIPVPKEMTGDNLIDDRE